MKQTLVCKLACYNHGVLFSIPTLLHGFRQDDTYSVCLRAFTYLHVPENGALLHGLAVSYLFSINAQKMQEAPFESGE